MEILYIVSGIFIWIALFLLVYFAGGRIIESRRRNAVKRFGTEDDDYAHEKWMFRFYVIVFFVGIPILFGIAVLQDLF